MSTNQYPGVNYGGSVANLDLETGIRYGVISQNSVQPEAVDDIFTHGEDTAYKEALAEAIRDARLEAFEYNEDPDDVVDEDEISDRLGENWETSLNNYLYERDGYRLTGCLDNDLFVLKSPFYTFAQFCSPCVPGAGNLDSPFEPAPNQTSAAEIITTATAMSFPRVYCLGHDWFTDGRAPYPVFRVGTDELVQP